MLALRIATAFRSFLLFREVENMENNTTEPEIVIPVEIRELTRIETDKGVIQVIHEISLGDMVLALLLAAMLIFMVLSRFISRG